MATGARLTVGGGFAGRLEEGEKGVEGVRDGDEVVSAVRVRVGEGGEGVGCERGALESLVEGPIAASRRGV